MTTISVPITSDMFEFIKDQIKSGRAANKADVMRKALNRLREEEAIQSVLKAEQEPTLKGSLPELAKKFRFQ